MILDKSKKNNIFQIYFTLVIQNIYNSLRYLKDAGQIGEISFGNGASRFDGMISRHEHAICNKCSKLVGMEIELPKEIVKLAAQFSKFKPESIELTLRGLYPECAKN